jgi:putative ABC transport system permease protein
MRSLGATSSFVFKVFLTQVLAIAGMGVLIGILGGMLVPKILAALYGNLLPVKIETAVSLGTIATSALYGFSVALLFALWPLGRAEAMSTAVLFRDQGGESSVRPRWAIWAAIALVGLALMTVAVVTADSQRIALLFSVGVVVVFAVFGGLGRVVTWGAGRIKRPRRPELALAIGNIAAPDGLTRSVILSLGTGLTLLTVGAGTQGPRSGKQPRLLRSRYSKD